MEGKTGIPRILIAGASSGVGKTTTVLALCKALQKRGLKVSVFKCGPDYLDPTYHSFASGSPCQNLDGWLMGREAVLDTFHHASRGSDIAVLEGVMGLFDGISPTGEAGSSAEIAKWLQAPTLVVLNAGGMSRTIAALAYGLKQYDPNLDVKGVVANFLGSQNHRSILSDALSPDLPLLGGFPKSPEQSFPERHLGLHSAEETESLPEKLEYWGNTCEEWFDLDRIWKIASEKNYSESLRPDLNSEPPKSKCRIGIARDAAFHFYYEDNLRRLRNAGAELVPFSPIADRKLPEVDGFYIGGGYPELYARELSENESIRTGIRESGKSGLPIYAECGGLMYLSQEIRTKDANSFPMVGLFPATVQMHDKLQALGYVEATVEEECILGQAGVRFRGHQFRYSSFNLLNEDGIRPLYRVRKRKGDQTFSEGYSKNNVIGSYVHAHWASNPNVPENFVNACIRRKS